MNIYAFQIRPKVAHDASHRAARHNIFLRVVVLAGVGIAVLRLDMKFELETGAAYVLSPTSNATWTDEDFIGRIARLSRRGHGRVLPNARAAIYRALGHYRRIWGTWFKQRGEHKDAEAAAV